MNSFAPTPYPPVVSPAWTLVDFLPDREPEDDDEWEEDEVSFVTLDFGRYMKPEAFHHVREVQLTNITGATPYACLGGQIFRGRHEVLIGSEILLAYSPKTEPAYTPLALVPSRVVFYPLTLSTGPTEADKKQKQKPKAPSPAAASEEQPPKPRRGRPKGSGAKKVVTAGGDDMPDPVPRRKPGPKPKAPATPKEPVVGPDGEAVVKKIGRPKGSKNKAKAGEPEGAEQDGAVATPKPTPKPRGRPPKAKPAPKEVVEAEVGGEGSPVAGPSVEGGVKEKKKRRKSAIPPRPKGLGIVGATAGIITVGRPTEGASSTQGGDTDGDTDPGRDESGDGDESAGGMDVD